MKISNASSTVKMILEKWPETRDSDNLLILAVWKKDNPKVKEISFLEFAEGFMKGIYTNPESIRRNRQALCNNFPHLRGHSYDSRHKNQAKVLEELRSAELFSGGTP